MADGLKDIVIKIRAEVDRRAAEKQFQELAENSKSSMEKTFRNFDKIVNEAFDDIGKNKNIVNNNPWMDFVDDFVDKFQQASQYIQNTGFLPKDMNSKLFQAYSNVDKLAQEYYKAVSAAEKLNAEIKQVPTEKFTKLQAELKNAGKNYTDANDKVERLKEQIQALANIEQIRSQIKPAKLTQYENQMALIQRMEGEVQKLNYALNVENNTGKSETRLMGERRALYSSIAKAEQDLNRIGAKNLDLIRQMNAEEDKLTFDYGTKGVKELEAELQKAKERAEELRLARLKIQTKVDNLTPDQRTRAELPEGWEEAQQRVKDLENEIVVASKRTEELEAAAKKTGHSFNQWRNAVWSISRLLGNVYTIGLDIARGARQIANFYMKMWNAAKKVLAIFKKLRESVKKTSSDHAKSWKQMLKDVFRYSLGIRSLFMLFRRLRGYIKEAFQAMAEQIPEVNAKLSELKSSFNALKGSFGTALEPAMAAFKNQLVQIIDLLAKVLTYIGMFIAALSGRGYVYQAKKVATSFADAAGSAKELNKQLQGFDELNNLTTNQGGGGGADSPLAQFEKVDVPDWIKNLAEILKNAWDRFITPIKNAWAKLGDEVVAAWKRAFSNVGNLLMDIARDFLDVWNNGLGESITSHILLIVRDIGNAIANLAEKIREAWNAVEEGASKSNGVRFWEAILTVVDKVLAGIQRITEDMAEWIKTLDLSPAMSAFVGWLESLIPIAEMAMEILFQFWDRALKPILTWTFDGENSGIAKFFRILQNFNEKLDKDKIVNDLNKIWDALGRFGQNVGEGLLIFVERMSDKIATWLNSDAFTQWCEDVANWLDSLDPEELADDLEQVVTIIQNIAKELWNAIKYVLDHKDQILDALEWASTHLKEIAAVFLGGKLAIDVSRFAANVALAAGAFSKMFAGTEGGISIFAQLASVLSGPVLIAIGAVVAAIGALTFAYGGIEGVINKIKETATNVINNLKEKADELGLTEKIEKLKAAFEKLKTALAPVIELLRGKLKSAFDVIFKVIEGLVSFLGSEVLNIISALVSMLTGVIEFITGFVNIIRGAIDVIVGLFTGDLSQAFFGAQRVWDGIKDIFKAGVDFIVGLVKGIVDLILEPFKQIKYYLIGDPIVIDMWEGIKKVFKDGIDAVVNFVKDLKEKVIQFFTDMKAKIDEKIEAIKSKFAEFANNIKEKKDEIANRIRELKEKLAEHFDNIKSKADAFKSNVSSIFDNIKSKVDAFKNDWVDRFNTIKSNLESFKSNISSGFEGIKSSVINAIEGIKNGIKSPINSVIESIEKMVNGIISGFNSLGDKLGSFEFETPDWLPGNLGGKKFELSMPKLNKISIPRLAQGAVIPPNKEFLAVLGDQKKGTNIESPLSTMVEAFNMANKGGNEQEIALLQEQNNLLRQLLQKEFGISERQIFNSVVNQNGIYKKSTGVSALA